MEQMLENVIIKGTKNSPSVIFNPDQGIMEIVGNSIMEDAFDFYSPIINWVSAYVELYPRDTIIRVDLEYFNTPTNKFLQMFFKALSELGKKGFSLHVYWMHESDDEDIWESGQRFSAISNVQFNYVIKGNRDISKLDISETETTPKVLLDPSGNIVISGNSVEEEMKEFFNPLIEWLHIYSKKPSDTNVTIRLSSFNTLTKMFLLLMVNFLTGIKNNGFKVNVKYYNRIFDIEDKFGIELSQFAELNIKIIDPE